MVDSQFQPDWFSKPGDTLLTMMEHHELSCDMLAEKLGRSAATIKGLLAGAVEIDENLANLLAKHVGGTPTFWRKRQATYVDSLARAAGAVPKQKGEEWLRQFPHADIVNYGWITKPGRRDDLLKAYLAFFGVTDPKEWTERYAKSFGVAFRTSPTFQSKAGALSAWLRRGELEASGLQTAKWNPQLLRQRLSEMRVLTKAKAPAYFLPRVRRICAEVGIALVFVRAPAGSRASGATRFISPDKAMIILSFRHLSDDHFWFTFFHELGHVLLHSASTTFIDGNIDAVNKHEREANEFSASVLIPPARRDELLDLKPRKENIIRFAFSVGVSPGIVVGQLQHNEIIKPSRLNFLKRRFDWDQIAGAVPSL
jgi:Zn-dependent peptidase ImmA (M78 family)/plasmid maintenance system antidote protein VapI